jgi:hypothetical protein
MTAVAAYETTGRAPPGRPKSKDRALSKARSGHSDQCVAAFDSGGSPRNSPSKTSAQAVARRQLGAAVGLIRRRFGAGAVMFAIDLLRGRTAP